MRSAGIDYASSGLSAIALAVDGEPQRSSVLKPTPKLSTPDRLLELERWLLFQLQIFKPDVVVVEELAVFLNKIVIRQMARSEGVSLLAGKKKCAVVISVPATSSRGIVFGRGNISKDDAWKKFPKMYPFLSLEKKTAGGTDQMDAYTHAIAAPVLLERR